MVFVATTVSNALFFAVSVAAARWLVPEDYAIVAAMLALVVVLTIPSYTLQVVVAREVAAAPPETRDDVAALVLRTRGMQAIVFGVVATTLTCAFAAPLSDALNLPTVWPVVLTALVAIPLLLETVLRGALQGTGRYGLLGTSIIGEAAGRLVVAIAFLAAGFGAVGVTAAPLAGACVGALACVPPLRHLAGRRREGVARPALGRVVWSTGAFFAGFALMTNADLLIVKHAITGVASGEYAAAAFVGKVVLLLPVAVTTVLVPEATARYERGADTRHLLTQALVVTAGLCGIVLAACVVAPGLVASVTFGSGYPAAEDLLWRYALAITMVSLAQVHALYRLATGSSIAAWACPAVAVLQLPFLWWFRTDPEAVIDVMIVSGTTLWMVVAAVPTRRTQSVAPPFAR